MIRETQMPPCPNPIKFIVFIKVVGSLPFSVGR
jgi:hypothetical protein